MASDPAVEIQSKALARLRTVGGPSVVDLSAGCTVLLVFLRHFGCTFCREAMADIASSRATLAERGVEIVLVHMADAQVAEQYFDRYGLAGVHSVCDPDCAAYRAFGLAKGNFHQLFGLQSWIRGFDAGVAQGHWVGYQQIGDGFQMPGVFAIRDGVVAEAFRHRVASDRPDYLKLAACCSVGSE